MVGGLAGWFWLDGWLSVWIGGVLVGWPAGRVACGLADGFLLVILSPAAWAADGFVWRSLVWRFGFAVLRRWIHERGLVKSDS